jgi:hypothetical protein
MFQLGRASFHHEDAGNNHHKMSSDNPDCKIFPSINHLMADPAHKKSLNF